MSVWRMINPGMPPEQPDSFAIDEEGVAVADEHHAMVDCCGYDFAQELFLQSRPQRCQHSWSSSHSATNGPAFLRDQNDAHNLWSV